MDSTNLTDTLDSIVDKSHQALIAIEENRWDDFIDIENQRQVLFEKIKSVDLSKQSSAIKCIEKILELNNVILSRSVAFQESLQGDLKKHYAHKNINNMYKKNL